MNRRISQRPRIGCTLAAVTLVASVGCTDSIDDASGPDPRPVGLPAPQPAALGETVSAAGVEVTVRSVESYTRSSDGYPRLRLIMRSRNVSDHDANNPEVGLRCAESELVGEWHLGSTWEATAFLPEGSVSEGELLVAFPSKSDTRFYPLGSCTEPRIRIVIGDEPAESTVFELSVDPALIDAALIEPRGPRFPLPTVVS